MITWQVDRRSVHPWTRLYLAAMRARRDDEAFEGAAHTLATARERQREGDRPPTRWTRLTTRVEEFTAGTGLHGWRVRPRRREPVAQVVYLHGGGYIHPLTPDYWRLARALSRVPAVVHVPTYSLAPDAVVDDVLPQLVELVTELTAQRPDLPVVVMGDSAGGALSLVTALQLRDQGRSDASPAAVFCLCPWLDATLGDPEVADLDPTDPVLAESGLRAAGRWWAGPRDPSDPLVSPVEASLVDLPPIEVLIGDYDILRPAVDRLARNAERDGAQLHVTEVCAMFHVWMTRAIPEGARTRRHLVDAVRRRTS